MGAFSRSDLVDGYTQEAYDRGIVHGRAYGRAITGGGSTGNDLLDQVKDIVDSVGPNSGSGIAKIWSDLEPYVNSSATAWAYNWELTNKIVGELNKRLEYGGFEPMTDAEFQKIIENSREGHIDGTKEILDQPEDTTTEEPEQEPEFELPLPPSPPTPPEPPRDPLSLDLNRNGAIDTLSRDAGVHFDLDNSGFAESTSWVAPGDGLLVLDRNNNGFIDGGAELFGTDTKLESGEFASNGFEALSEFDKNGDKIIDSFDGIYDDLRVWVDGNSDGVSQSDELLTLSELGISSIDLQYSVNEYTDPNGVVHQEEGQFYYEDGSSGLTNTLWFNADRSNTIPVDIHNGSEIVIPDSILELPDAVGYGNVYSLHHAMTLDASGRLQGLVENFVTETNPENRDGLIDEILAVWSGTDGVAEDSRGYYINGKSVSILEAFWGQPALQENPNGRYADSLKNVYQNLRRSVYTQLMAGSHSINQFNLISFETGENGITADFSDVSAYFANQFSTGSISVSTRLKDFMKVVSGVSPYNDSLTSGLMSSLEQAALGLDYATQNNMLSVVRAGNNNIVGSDVSDSIYGFDGDDRLDGLSGRDYLSGGDGNDHLYGGEDDDILVGGGGDDKLFGGKGSDILMGDGDSDKLYGGDGDDVMRGGGGS